MKYLVVVQLMIFSLLALSSLARERNCTTSGHKCNSTIQGNSYPCKGQPNDRVCANDLFTKPRCDYCPELHNAAVQGPSYRQLETACRQEDGFYRCKLGGLKDNCVRRTWMRQYQACVEFTELVTTSMTCTDDEMTCRLQGRCVKRFDINSDYQCVGEPRRFYLPCHEDEFECKLSRKCLPRDWVRDGSVDCSVVGKIHDTSDEDQPLVSCDPQTEFRCQDGNGRCISREMVMDGRSNCPDSSDEKQALNCHIQTEFKCKIHGRCIRRYRVNDGFPDCPNGTDESLFKLKCKNQTEFDCGDGRCIPRSWVGNSLIDCKSGIDESAKLSKCLKDEFMCRDGSRCLPKKYLCDGIKNCADCSDEMELCHHPLRFRCKDDPSVCLPWTHTCDNVKDCIDGSDEDTRSIQGFTCRNKDNICYVPQSMLKSNISMCTDSSDKCFDGKGNFLCARCLDGNRIIAKHQLCDGIIDCVDLSDECPCQDGKVGELCDIIFHKFNKTESPYRNQSKIREKVKSVCNGVTEWDNKLDEKFCKDKQFTKQENVSLVETNHKCKKVPEAAMKQARNFGAEKFILRVIKENATWCDGHIECGFYDDECSEECQKQPEFCQTIEKKSWRIGIGINATLEMRTCQNASTLMETIPPKLLCDGVQHCTGGEDEHNCTNRIYCDAGTGTTVLLGVKPIVSISKMQKCDLNADCLDSRDEMNCSEETHFYCKGKQPLFIDKLKYLDGHADCKDYSDECPIELFAENIFSSRTELLSSIVLRVFIWIVATTSLIGNLWVIVTTIQELRTIDDKNSTGYCNRMMVTNLAVADFLTGICLWILIAKSIEFSGEYCLHDVDWKMSTTCDAIGVMLVISSETSLNMIIVLTALRLYSVLRTAKRVNYKYCCCITIISWFTSILIAFYPVWYNKNFSSSIKITKNSFFKHTLVNRTALEKYYELSEVIKSFGSNTSSFASNQYLTSDSAKFFFPQRYIHVEGVYGYYSSNSVCFPNYFNLSATESSFSLAVILYNTAAILFVIFSYIIFYKKATSATVATNSVKHIQRNETLKNKITVLVLTSAACWLPICVMSFYTSFSNTKDSLPEVTYVISAVVLLPIDSCFNPLLYSEAHVKVINAARNVLQKVSQIKYRTSSFSFGSSFSTSLRTNSQPKSVP